MIEKLNTHYSFTNPASVHDEEALTALELAGRTAAKVNEVVGAQNDFQVKMTEAHKDFQTEMINAHDDLRQEWYQEKTEVIPTRVDGAIQNHINSGDFDEAIDKYAGELSKRVDNLLMTNLPQASTTFDAEIIDARLGQDGVRYDNLGKAIRAQFIRVERRYRNHVISQKSILNINIDTTTKTITLTGHPTQAKMLFASNTQTALASETLSCTFNYAQGTQMLCYNPTTKEMHTMTSSPEVITGGDYIIMFFMINSNFVVSGISAHPEIAKIVSVNGTPFQEDKAIKEITDARKGYDGTEYDTLGYAVREQATKFARRYKNHVRGIRGAVGISIETAFKNVRINMGTTDATLMLWGNNVHCAFSGKTVYDVAYPAGPKTYELYCRSNPAEGEDRFYFVLQSSSNITETDYLVMTLYVGSDGAVYNVMACDDVLDLLYINGVKHRVNTDSYNKYTCNIFKRVVCCGDSFTSGHMTDGNGVVHPSNPDYAWPAYMGRLTGASWENCGVSGATTLSWLGHEDGLAKAKRLGLAQAYVVGLMINDATSTNNKIPLGTEADIVKSVSESHANTYYGCLSKIIYELLAISPKAKIFVLTCPRTGEPYADYNAAVHDVAGSFYSTASVHVLDLYSHRDKYRAGSLPYDAKDGHYTAIGYEQMAEIMRDIMSDYIHTNVARFQDVPFIPYISPKG